jgi:hypothetical protein
LLHLQGIFGIEGKAATDHRIYDIYTRIYLNTAQHTHVLLMGWRITPIEQHNNGSFSLCYCNSFAISA